MAGSAASTIARSPSIDIAVGADPCEWDRYIDRHPEATGYHLYGWSIVFANAFGHRSAYLTARRGGEIAGVLPLTLFQSRVFGKYAISVPFLNYGGVLADDDEVAQALLDRGKTIVAERGLSHLELRHLHRRFEDLPCKTHKVTMLLPLAADEASMWTALDRKVRNQVRKAEKSELTAHVGGIELLDDFYPVFATNMRDLGTPVYAKRFFAEVFTAFPDRSRIFSIRKGSQSIAAGIGWRYRDTFEMPWASSLREYRSLSANNLLYWETIKHAIASGASIFDFGRSTPNEGTYNFKEQWGAKPHPLYWEYAMRDGGALPDHSPKNPKFALAINLWKRLPLGVANALGPHLVRSLP